MKLFVSNISFNAHEDDLRAFFVEAGYVPLSVRVRTKNEGGRKRCFGFVEVEDEAAQKAIEDLDGRDLMGRTLNVQPARDDRPRARGAGAG